MVQALLQNNSSGMNIDHLIADFANSVRSPQKPRPVLHKSFNDFKIAPLARPASAPTLSARLSAAAWARAENILAVAANRGLARLSASRTMPIYEAFEQAVSEHCASVIAAAKIDPQRQVRKEQEALKAIRDQRQAARKSLSEELKSARRNLRQLRGEISAAEDIKRDKIAENLLRAIQEQALADGYKPVPLPSIEPHPQGAGLPAEPGIYFLWLDQVIDYVGRGIRLCDRLKLGRRDERNKSGHSGGHHILTARHRISYLIFPKRELTWAESYYIGLTRAVQNFGAVATHRASTEP